MIDQPQLISLADASQRIGMPKRTLARRVATDGSIVIYRDGFDRRRHLIDMRDLPRLIEIQPVTREEPSAA